jgi:hypothetical protein
MVSQKLKLRGSDLDRCRIHHLGSHQEDSNCGCEFAGWNVVEAPPISFSLPALYFPVLGTKVV